MSDAPSEAGSSTSSGDSSTVGDSSADGGGGVEAGGAAPEGGEAGGLAPEGGDAATACTNVVCTASDQCHLAGTCDPMTGTCSNPASPNSASCTGGACKNDLSAAGAGDFTIKFTITTIQGGEVAVLNQRSLCGVGVFWDIRMNAGILNVETDDGTAPGDTGVLSTVPVNDGASHVVIVRRVAQVIEITVDGNAAGMGPSAVSLASLQALKTGTDVCVGVDITTANVGQITDVCITSP